MKVICNTESNSLSYEHDGERRELPLYSTEAFDVLSQLWLKVGWNQKYPYTFSWMGRPIIQLPEDMIRMQEVLYQIKPTVVVETGVAHGGSLIYYAGLLQLFGGGRVIGVDIHIRSANRAAIEAHALARHITLIEGDSAAPSTVEQVGTHIGPNDRVLVILDSNHTREHVARELDAYHGLVSPGSYIVATDGIMSEVADVPRGNASWNRDNPTVAAAEFAQRHPEFVVEQPAWPFNESELRHNVTHWPGAWLRRTTPA